MSDSSSNSPPAPLPTASSVGRYWYAGLLVLLAFVLGCSPLRTSDLWWHLKTGELILERGIPRTDWFTYTSQDREWIDLHWGFQLLIVGVKNIAGLAGLSVFKGICFALTISIAWSTSSRDLSPACKALLWYCPLSLLLEQRSMVRPELITFLMLSAFLWVFHRADRQPRWLWSLPVLQVLWVNCHGLFILGPFVLGCWLLDHTGRQWWSQKRSREFVGCALSWKHRVGLLSTVCGACLLNPYFLKGAMFPFVLFRKLSVDRAIYATQITEFYPTTRLLEHLNPRILQHCWILGVLVISIASFLFVWSLKRFSLFRLLLFIAFAFLASRMLRNLALFALVSGVIQVQNFHEYFVLRRRLASTQQPSSRVTATVLSCLVSALFGVSIVCGLTGQLAEHTHRYNRFGFGEYPELYTHDVARFTGQPGMPEQAFIASFAYASEYLYHNGPARRVFLDGRLEVASVETFQTYVKVKRLLKASDPAFANHIEDREGNLPCLILSHSLADGASRIPGWRPVFVNQNVVVFLTGTKAEELNLPRVNLPDRR